MLRPLPALTPEQVAHAKTMGSTAVRPETRGENTASAENLGSTLDIDLSTDWAALSSETPEGLHLDLDLSGGDPSDVSQGADAAVATGSTQTAEHRPDLELEFLPSTEQPLVIRKGGERL
jgi:hypothetical protein